MTPRKRKVNRSATDRLKRLIETELDQQELTDEEAAREGSCPATQPVHCGRDIDRASTGPTSFAEHLASR